MSEQGDQFQDREQEGDGDAPGSEQDGGLGSPGGTDKSRAQQGDVAHEGDLPTEDVPEAD